MGHLANHVHERCEWFVAGVEGIEPPVAVLETAGLPLTDTPRDIKTLYIASSCFAIESREEAVKFNL